MREARRVRKTRRAFPRGGAVAGGGTGRERGAARPTAGGSAAVRGPRAAGTQHRGQVIADGLLQLRVGAGTGLPVRPPPDELGGVPEPLALHVVVLHFDHPLRAQRRKAQVLVPAPPAPFGVARRPRPLLLPVPRPRVVRKVGDQRLEFLKQFLAAL